MKRREFITLLGGAAAVWPFAGRAQQPDGMRRIGVLMTALESDSEYQTYVSNLRKELQNLGWAEGRGGKRPGSPELVLTGIMEAAGPAAGERRAS
jgi:hypothetical protein